MKNLILLVSLMVHASAFAQWSNTADNTTSGKLTLGSSVSSGHQLQIKSVGGTMPSVDIGQQFADTGGSSRLMFWAGSNSGTYANGFFVDYIKNATEDRLSFKDGAAREAMTWLYGGKIGVGISNPLTTFQVGTNSGKKPSIGIGIPNGDTNGKSQLTFYAGTATAANGFSVIYNKTSTVDKLVFKDGGNVQCLTIFNGGGVGVGIDSTKTSIGNYKFSVQGKLGAQEIVVTTTGWSDYVFDNDYKLPSIESVKQYIVKHKHLPGVPTAQEIKENGMNVGDTNALLLKKIEELTLYVIELKSELDEVKAKVK